MRSISTSVISALPIVALMVVAVWLMGVGTLKDLALIQLIGVVEGVFSSIFLATPILVGLMNRRKDTRKHNQEVADYRAGRSVSPDSSEVAEDSADSDELFETASRRTVSGPGTPGVGSTWRPDRR